MYEWVSQLLGELRTAQNQEIAPDYSTRRIAWPRDAVAPGLLASAEGQTPPRPVRAHL